MPKKTSKADAGAAAPAAKTSAPATIDASPEAARTRLGAVGRNDECPCNSGKKYKKCHMPGDEAASAPPVVAPDPLERIANGWRMFEQRRPGAAEKEFRAALALNPELAEAQVGVGLAKLSAGDSPAAREALSVVVTKNEALLADLRSQGVTDAFTRREAQPVLRASHALGCLAFDEDRYDDAIRDLERVYAIDAGPVGTEARLIAGKTFIKSGKPADALPVLEEAAKSTNGPGRAHMTLALAHFLKGDPAAAATSLGQALALNQYFGKAVLGQIRKQVDNPLGATPGSREEAAVYAQTYGDAWDDKAKEFLDQALAAAPGKPAAASGTAPDEASAG
jgi:tetratricopeptide (TPR) repeat protein